MSKIPAASRAVASPPSLAFLLLALGAAPALGKQSAEELAKLAQNPIANLVSVPFQNNTNFDFGPADGADWQLRAQVQLMFPK